MMILNKNDFLFNDNDLDLLDLFDANKINKCQKKSKNLQHLIEVHRIKRLRRLELSKGRNLMSLVLILLHHLRKSSKISCRAN